MLYEIEECNSREERIENKRQGEAEISWRHKTIGRNSRKYILKNIKAKSHGNNKVPFHWNIVLFC